MKIYCKELDQSFDSKDEMFKALLENESVIIDSKKAIVYKSFEKGLAVCVDQKSIQKSFNDAEKGIKFDDDYFYFVVNSSNILDTHNDMHVDGNWNKTVKEQQGKVYLVFDHNLKREEIIFMRKDIELITAKIPFTALGKDYEGESYCLIYKCKKDKIVNKTAKEWLEAGHELEASVRMQYVKIEACYNTKDKEYAKQKENYDLYYPQIANKSDFKEIDYFWAVLEAKNVYESSLVLFGSNNATGEISQNNKEADIITSDVAEPLKDTQEADTAKERIFIM